MKIIWNLTLEEMSGIRHSALVYSPSMECLSKLVSRVAAIGEVAVLEELQFGHTKRVSVHVSFPKGIK